MQQEGESQDEDMDLSFIHEINQKLENSYIAMQGEETSHSNLMKLAKKETINIDPNQFNYHTPERQE